MLVETPTTPFVQVLRVFPLNCELSPVSKFADHTTCPVVAVELVEIELEDELDDVEGIDVEEALVGGIAPSTTLTSSTYM